MSTLAIVWNWLCVMYELHKGMIFYVLLIGYTLSYTLIRKRGSVPGRDYGLLVLAAISFSALKGIDWMSLLTCIEPAPFPVLLTGAVKISLACFGAGLCMAVLLSDVTSRWSSFLTTIRISYEAFVGVVASFFILRMIGQRISFLYLMAMCVTVGVVIHICVSVAIHLWSKRRGSHQGNLA